MSSPAPSFDLVVATVARVSELDRFLDSVGMQTQSRVRVILVDQNEDDRLAPVVERHARLVVVRVRSEPGLSRARNRGLQELTSDVVAFPDDDCRYAHDLLERVARRLATEPSLDGLSGRSVDADGRASESWEIEPALLTADNLWNRVNSAAIFLRRDVVERIGGFDEQLGLGSGTPWSSGEEVDYMIRAVRAGARIAYEPGFTILHDPQPFGADGRRALAYRDGASVGYLLRKHGYSARMRARMLARPLGGTVLSLVRLDAAQARVHLETLRGRIAGYSRSRT